MPEVADVSEIKNAAASFVREVANAEARMAARGLGRWLAAGDPGAGIPLLGRIRLRLEYFYAAAEERRILLFFTRKGVERLLLRATLDVELRPVPSTRDGIDAPGLTYSVVFPSFAMRHGDAPVRRGLPETGPGDQVLRLAIGPISVARLAVVFPGGDTERGRLFWSPTSTLPFRSIGPDSSGRWPFAPFAALIETIENWLDTGSAEGRAVLVPRIGIGPEGSGLRRIVTSLVDTFLAVRSTVRSGGQEGVVRRPPLDLTRYRAQVLLRTRRDGEIARSDDDDPFHLLLRLSWSRTGSGDHLRAELGPPDFLVSGELLAAFGTCFWSRSFRETVTADLVGEEPPAFPTQELCRDLGEAAARGDVTVFRTGRRGEVDRDIAVTYTDGVVEWILAADYVLSPEGPGKEREVRCVGHATVLYARREDGDRVGGELVDYFRRLTGEISRWVNVDQRRRR